MLFSLTRKFHTQDLPTESPPDVALSIPLTLHKTLDKRVYLWKYDLFGTQLHMLSNMSCTLDRFGFIIFFNSMLGLRLSTILRDGER